MKSINQCKSVIQTSYDIIKAHGGEIKVESKEGEGSEFVIQLPVVDTIKAHGGEIKVETREGEGSEFIIIFQTF